MVLTNGKNSVSQIEIAGDRILIHNLQISGDAVDYLQRVPESERKDAIIKALEVGIFCLERTQTAQDVDFVKRQIQSLLAEVKEIVGGVPKTVELELLNKIGTAEGQVLAPVQTQVLLASRQITNKLDDVKTILSQDIDPAKESSVLGSVLKTIKNLLDSNRKDSVQGVFTAALKDVTAENGILAKAVKAAVLESVKPLADEVDKLAKEIRAKEAVEAALLQTIAKGISYEEEVVKELQLWSKSIGAEVHHIGKDNQPGDILIKLSPTSIAGTEISIVIEVRDRDSDAWGRKRISDHLAKAMTLRRANAAIFLSRSSVGLAQDIGEMGEGVCEHGCWVATTHQNLNLAIRFLLVQQRLMVQRASQPEIDAIALQDQLQRIRTTLKRIATINRHLTDVRKSANSIETEAEILKQEIRSVLESIENAIRR